VLEGLAVGGESVTDGVSGAAGRVSLLGCTGRGAAAPVPRILKPMLADWPPTTVTLSSEKPRLGCHARIRYLPAGMSAMLKDPLAAVFVEYG